MRKYTTVTLPEDSYWKLADLKAKLKCKTWAEFVEKIYKMVGGNNEKHAQ